jgi:multidrug efflux system membrane fusion protein
MKPELTKHLTETPAPAPVQGAEPLTVKKPVHWSRWILFLAMIVAAWYSRPFWLPHVLAAWPHGAENSAGSAKPAPRAVPVVAAKVRQRDMNLYLNCLGTVTAFNTVALRSRVDGELVNVAFTEGQVVKQGDLLAEIDPRSYRAQLDQARGQLDRDEAALRLAQVTLARYEDLLKSQATTPQTIDQQVALVQQSEGMVKTDKALVENAELQLTYCRILAPINGRIGLRLVDKGNIVHANDPNGLAVITQLQPISLVFTIPQDDIPRVLRQMQLQSTLPVDAYDRDFRTKLASGRLAAVDNQVDSATGTLRLKALFSNADGVLFPNQFVNVRLLVETLPQAILAPAAAVQRGPAGNFVYVVRPDETVDLRPVETGPTEGQDVAISSGLQAGELVVTDGLDKLQKGSKVALRDESRSGGGAKPAPAAAPAGEKPAGPTPPDADRRAAQRKPQ